MSPDRYVHTGPEPLSEIDLLSLLLARTPGGRSPRTTAAALLDEHGSLRGLVRAGPLRLSDTPGVGLGGAVRLHAALTLGLRAAREVPEAVGNVLGPHEAYALLGPRLSGLDHEQVWALYLGVRGRVLHAGVVSDGTSSAAPFEARTILRRAVLHDANAVVLAHNHPSGDPEPSPEDISTTRSVARACEAAGLRLLDHLVVGGARWVSLAERGHVRWS